MMDGKTSRIFSKKVATLTAFAIAAPFLAGSVSASIADLYSGGAGTYTETGTVTAILNVRTDDTTFVVQDGTGSAIAYRIPLITYTPNVGDTLNFTGTNSPYQGSPEIVATDFAVNSITPGTAPAPTILTVPAFNATGDGSVGVPPYAESIVELDGVSISEVPPSLDTYATYTLDDGSGNTAKMYTYASDSAVADAVTAANAANPGGFTGTYNIVGYADEYYGAAEIYPLSITAVPEPASIGLLALAGLPLVTRRRHR